MVGWGKLAASDLLDQSPFPSNTEVEVAYRKSTQNLGIVGEKVAKFILNYMKMGLLRPDLIHLIGHSLGCHISGYIGTRVSTVAGFPIARITGKAKQLFPVSTNSLDKSRQIFHSRQLKLNHTY